MSFFGGWAKKAMLSSKIQNPLQFHIRSRENAKNLYSCSLGRNPMRVWVVTGNN